ncbi:MAG: secretin N-terminal domain-containing protein [Planctomycetota bacterium]|jgi:type IV pilus assembly protein PilQ
MSSNAWSPSVRGLVCLTVGIILATGFGAPAQELPEPPEDQTGIKVLEKGTIDLNVQGADLRRVLQLLSTQGKANIVATSGVQGTVTVNLYNVTPIQCLEAVLESAGFRYVRDGKFIYVMTQKEHADYLADKRELVVKVFRLSYLTAADAKTYIESVLSSEGSVSVGPAAQTGVSSSATVTGGNASGSEDILVVRDYQENLEKVTQILKELDVRPQMVLIEATILRATLDEDNHLGIDFNALAGIDFRGVAATSSGGTSLTLGSLPSQQLDNSTTAFRTDFAAAVPNGGLSIGFISNNIAFFIRALENVTDVAVLANPKILVVNKQHGEVMVGKRDGYITTTFTETTASQSVEFLETGTQLVVRPYIGADGYVRMELHPEDSTGGLTAESLPYEHTTECTSNVMVKDGHTIVIGGLFRERTSNVRSQIPGLGSLPVVGPLFRRARGGHHPGDPAYHQAAGRRGRFRADQGRRPPVPVRHEERADVVRQQPPGPVPHAMGPSAPGCGQCRPGPVGREPGPVDVAANGLGLAVQGAADQTGHLGR